MTDSEIIKALEEAINTYNEKGVFVSAENLQQQALDLIKRQKKELEDIKDKKAIVFKLSEEQLSEVNENLLKSVEYNERKIKAEAYKEFAERLKKDLFYKCGDINYSETCDLRKFIDSILEELVGDDK